MANHGPPKLLFGAKQIEQRVHALGYNITHYARQHGLTDLLVLGTLKGAFIFLADLVRHIHYPHTIDFLIVDSYEGQESTGLVRWRHTPNVAILGRDVILVEDIVDSGVTLKGVCGYIKARKPKSLNVCTMLHKNKAIGPLPRWIGFGIPDNFVVGYGLDLDEQYRHLPYIGVLNDGV